MELRCAIQNYAWGIRGMVSSVAQLAKGASPDIIIEETLPYAELWMGTHANGPSVLKETGENLSDYIARRSDALGTNVTSRFGQVLPFLFKVLSVNQALSIQAHPNKSHAEELHASRPNVYKDPNHKPEMAIALTPFQALCGFRPPNQLVKHFEDVPELREVIGEEVCSAFVSKPSEEALKTCFSALMNAPKEKVSTSLKKLAERFSTMDETKANILLRDTFLTLNKQYPGDGGCFALYLLNFIVLEPGEAMFLGPDIIHAYLLGDCMECMACSDNVVRAGLTPKYQDVETLVAMLKFEMSSAESRKFQGVSLDDDVTLFNPPVPDFAVQMIKVTNKRKEICLLKEDSASIFIVIDGKGSDVSVTPPPDGGSSPSSMKRGSTLFLDARQEMSFMASPNFLAFRALCL